ncbi:MAG: helix-turn-helix transcriptional regulator [Clostridia bacterium]|nr:helix-turn-helix transcriptional regulator [Clostridia bacterium]
MITEEVKVYTSNILQILGHNIQRIREKKQLSYLDIAKLSNYDRQYIATLELGKKDIQLSTAIRISSSLNVPLSKLFTRTLDIDSDMIREGYTGDDFLLIFSSNVRKYLKSSGKKEIHIYMETGMDPAVINRILNKKTTNPRISSLSKIAFGVGVELNTLLSRSEGGKYDI